MNVDWLEAFGRVARTLSMTAAARELHLSRSTVADRVRGLERDLGTPLLVRRGNTLSLTPAGHRLLEHTPAILALVTSAYADVAGSAAPRVLRVGVPDHVHAFAMGALRDLFADAPDADRRVVTIGSSARLRALIRDGHLDVALVDDTSGPSADVAEQLVWVERPALLAAPRTDVARGETPLLLSAHGCAFRAVAENVVLPQLGARARTLDVGSVAAVRDGICAGKGLGLLPTFAARVLVARGEATLLPWSTTHTIRVRVAWNRRACPPWLQQRLQVVSSRTRTRSWCA